LIVGAKNVVSSRILSEKIKDREIEKYYLAKIHGIITPKQAVLTAYLTEQEHNTVKISKKPLSNESKQIVTEYKTISHDENTSIIEVHLITGRKHQIRAHMNFINHPLVGERKYTNEFAKKDSKSYQYLISYKIVFNFKQNSGTLSYLKNKEIVLKNF
jgi:23S rRNA pseudouridine955/2504/2580 synthase